MIFLPESTSREMWFVYVATIWQQYKLDTYKTRLAQVAYYFNTVKHSLNISCISVASDEYQPTVLTIPPNIGSRDLANMTFVWIIWDNKVLKASQDITIHFMTCWYQIQIYMIRKWTEPYWVHEWDKIYMNRWWWYLRPQTWPARNSICDINMEISIRLSLIS